MVWHGTRITSFAFGCLDLIINRPGPAGLPSSTTRFPRLSSFCCTFKMTIPPFYPFFVPSYWVDNLLALVAHFHAIMVIVRSHPFIATTSVNSSFDYFSIVIIQWNYCWSIPSCHFFTLTKKFEFVPLKIL